MRNLKKVLSLALALVMLLGMMVVGAGAATSFKDDDKIDNQVAVAVSNKIGVLVGDENGNFNPDGTLTRAEAAVAIARLDLGTSAANALAATNAATFKDVPVTHWGKPYIDYCAGNGYIVGDENGNFLPNKTVTSVEFATMVSRMLGYDTKVEGIEGNADWAVKAAALARKAGLSTDVMLTTTAAMTRDDMAQMVFNSLTAPLVEYEGLNVSVNGVSLTSNVKVRTHATDTGNNNTTYNGEKIQANITPIRLCEEKFPDLKLSTTTDAFKRTQSVWTWKQVNIAGSAKPVGANFEFHERKTSDAVSLNGAVGDAETLVYIDGKKQDTTGKTINAAYVAGLTHNGRQVEIYLNPSNYKDIDKIVVVNTYVARATALNSTADKVTVTPLSTTPEGKSGLLTKTFKTTDVEVGDTVTYTAAYGSDGKYAIQEMNVLANPITGTLTAWKGTSTLTDDTAVGNSGSNFTVDSNDPYKYSVNNYIQDDEGTSLSSGGGIAAFKVNESQINVYLDKYGFAIYVSGVEGTKNYAAVIGVGDSNTHGSKTVGVTLLFPDGTTKEVTAEVKNVADTAKNAATKLSTANADDVGSASDAQLVKDGIGDVVSYRIKDNDVYELTLLGYEPTNTGTAKAGKYTGKYWTSDGSGTVTPDTENELGIGQTTGARASNTGASFTNGKAELKVGTETLYANADTIFMVATGSGENWEYNVYIGYKNMPSIDETAGITGIAYGTRSVYSNQLDIVYISATTLAGLNTVDTYFVLKEGQEILTDSTGSYFLANAIVDGEETQVKVDVEATSPAVVTAGENGANVANPGLYAIKNVHKDKNDIITSFNDALGDMTGAVSGTVAASKVVLGLGGNGVKADATYFGYDEKTKVIVVAEDFSSISLGSVATVQDDKNDGVYYTYDSSSRILKDVVIVEVDDTDSYTVAGNTGYRLSTDNSTWKTAGTGINVKDGSKGYVKADTDYAIDVAATKAKGITLTKESSDPDVYSFVVTEAITNDKIVTKSTVASKYGSVVKDTDTNTVAATLDNVDFSKTAAYDMTGNAISQFNKIVGKNLVTQITDYLTYKGYTGIGQVNRNTNDDGYEVTATDPDGIGVKVTLANSAIDDINEVTIDGKIYYTAASNKIDDITELSYVKGTHGTFAKCDSSFVDVASGTLVSGKSYTTGYFKVAGNTAALLAPSTASATITGSGSDTRYKIGVTVDDATKGEWVAADNAWYVKANATLSVAVENATLGAAGNGVGSVTIALASATATAKVGNDALDTTNGKVTIAAGTAIGAAKVTVTITTFTDSTTVNFTGAAS